MSYIVHKLDSGRLGNQLFQIASTIGLGDTYTRTPIFPKWKYNDYLANVIPTYEQAFPTTGIGENKFEFDRNYWDSAITSNKGDINVGLWLQSEKYFEGSRDKIREQFKFRQDYEQDWLAPHHFLGNGKETICISIRKGEDYIQNGNYEILPILYYILALEHNFPDWRENYNVVICSDEIGYCKTHFQGENIYYAEGIDIQQLCIGSQAKHFILANSTFSWWLAWLGEEEGSKIIRPATFFKGGLAQSLTTATFWPERWSEFDHRDKKIKLKDVTFTIPVYYDHGDRDGNLNVLIRYLDTYLDTNIIVGEQGTTFFKNRVQAKYMHFNKLKEFHRTKMLNELADSSDTPYIVNYDTDVILPPLQILTSVYLLRRGFADVVYPYDGRFARVPRSYYNKISEQLDVGVFKDTTFTGTRSEDAKSVGGAIFFNKESFIRGGMENENMISYGPEDVERHQRFSRLGYKVRRVSGIIYHLDHFVGQNSSANNPRFSDNEKELWKEQKMTDKELLEYVDTWPWIQKYSEAYYENIVEDAIRSGQEILGAVKSLFTGIQTVLDVSGGVGEFSVGSKEQGLEYILTDYKIPKSKLLVQEYHEFNLQEPNDSFPISRAFDLVICTEVAEHLHEKYARKLIELLCSKGDLVLFSAAIPYQGGLFHINEQWQSYWANLFEEQGFYPCKVDIRSLLKKSCAWYRQNLVIYVKRDYYKDHSIDYELDLVLPEMYLNVVQHYKERAAK